MSGKPNALISPNSWPARRPDGQTANAESDPAPTVKGSSVRPGQGRIEARVPTQIAHKFKRLCAILGVEQKDIILELVTQWMDSISGRLDGQTAIYQIRDDLMKDDGEIPSSNLDCGRPDGQEELSAKRRDVLAYYSKLTGNQIRQSDRDYLETLLDIPTWKIKCGIAMSVYKCKTPLHNPHVGSLKYCAGAIAEVSESGIDQSYFGHVENVLRRTGKLPAVELPTPPAKQPALPGASNAGDLIDLNRKDNS